MQNAFDRYRGMPLVCSTARKNRERAARDWRSSLWAERWSEWIKTFAGLADCGVPSYNIYFKIISDVEGSEVHRQLKVAMRPIYDSLILYTRRPHGIAKRQLVQAADQLHKLGYDCWVSYREGHHSGDPDQRPKLFLTVAKSGSIRKIVILDDYLRYYADMDFDLLPKPLPYLR